MLLSKNQLDRIAQHQPVNRSEFSLMRAAVAIILRDGEHGTEFLLMQRAKHPKDPWSGQMSFPGGKIDPEDATSKDAAIREAEEEVGIVLGEQDYIGRLDDIYGLKVDNQYSVHVACYVFKPQQPVNATGNHEVADLVWLPFSWLQDEGNRHDYWHPSSPDVAMPAVLIDEDKEQVLWGLSLRMMSMLHELIDEPLPVLSEEHQIKMKMFEEHNMSSKNLDQITEKVLQRGSN